MTDRTRYIDEVMSMTNDEFAKAWKSGEIQRVVLEELEMDMNTLPIVIEHNTNEAIKKIRDI